MSNKDWRIVSLVAILVLATLSFLPFREKTALHTKGRLHPWGHLAVFCLMTFALTKSGSSTRSRMLLLCGPIALAYGIEWSQSVIYAMPMERVDVVVDAVGALMGGILAFMFEPPCGITGP